VLLADEQAETVYSKATGQAGIFHMWVPGTWAALLF
jgi:hypothetical protein